MIGSIAEWSAQHKGGLSGRARGCEAPCLQASSSKAEGNGFFISFVRNPLKRPDSEKSEHENACHFNRLQGMMESEQARS
jgi:hypothetical protein